MLPLALLASAHPPSMGRCQATPLGSPNLDRWAPRCAWAIASGLSQLPAIARGWGNAFAYYLRS